MRRKTAVLINPPVLAVDQHQLGVYAEAYPVGLLQIGSYLLARGYRVRLIDMMEYEVGKARIGALPTWGAKRAGSAKVRGRALSVRLFGKPLSFLAQELEKTPAVDEFYVTSTLTFNFETTWSAVRICRSLFPAAKIKVGGAYPTLLPEHAAGCGAEVHEGNFIPAQRLLPSYDLLPKPPAVGIFRLAGGCRYNCSFCANRALAQGVVFEPKEALEQIRTLRERTGVAEFSNWDPNVMLHKERLKDFLRLVVAADMRVRLKFEMGIQPDRLDDGTLTLMREAGVFAMTIPLESANSRRLRAFGKPYDFETAVQALIRVKRHGFDMSRCHVTSVLGCPEEKTGDLFRLFIITVLLEANPTPFPLSLSPRTRDYDKYLPLIRGKPLDELNGHLWPLARSAEELVLKRRLLDALSEPDIGKAWRRIGLISGRLGAEFEAEYGRSRKILNKLGFYG